jgi:hypothetical protein
VVWLTNSSEHDFQSWLTGQIAGDYIDANRGIMANRAYDSQRFSQKTFGPQDPAVLSNDSLDRMIQSKALPAGADDAKRWRSYTGTYGVDIWGHTLELHKVRLKNEALTLDGERLTEVQPGLFFLKNGEVLDLRRPVFYYRNTRLDKIGQGTVIFYTVLLSICALGCLLLLVWQPIRWLRGKIRGGTSAAPRTLVRQIGGGFSLLAALVGLVLFGVLVKFPFLVLDGPWLPTPSSTFYISFFLLSPYIILALTMAAAVFTWMGWKGSTDGERWIDIGKIALLAVYALVVI